MSDLIDIIGKLKPEEISDINDQDAINKLFNEKLGDELFNKYFGGKLDLLDKDNGIYSTGGDPPEFVYLKEYKEYSSVDVDTTKDPSMTEGRTKLKFKSLGFTDTEIINGGQQLDDFFKKQDQEMTQTPAAKALQAAYDAEKKTEKKTDPTSDKDLDDSTKDKIKEVVNETLKQKDKNESAGKWVKSGIKYGFILALLAAGGAGLYEAVSHHQDAMNGCWIMDMTTGQKCKVTELTCAQGPKINIPDGDSKCGLCVDITNPQSCGSLDFNPCLIGGKATKPPTEEPFPDSGKNCDTVAEYCKDSDTQVCKNCDPSLYNLIGNSKMVCVNVTWWGALEDLIGGPLDTAISATITMILNILKWTAVGIVILLVLYIIYRLTKYETSRGDVARPDAK